MFAIGQPPLHADSGLALELRQGASMDRLVLPYAALCVGATNAPSRFLAPGAFVAEFAGFVSVDLRAQYTFTAESTVPLELLINGKEVLALTNSSAASESSKPVRLNKGTNSFVVRLKPLTNQPASVRILWASRNNPVPVPIPASALSHNPDAELKRSLAAHNGAFLVEQFRCGKCHLPDGSVEPDSPSLDGIGSRLNREWVARWVLEPAAQRPARMPRIFHGPDAPEKATAVAAFLSSISETARTHEFVANDSLRPEGEGLFRDLQCGSCHSLPQEAAVTDRISLAHLAEKFRPAALAQFLENPQAHYPANPMPNFKLTAPEAQALTVFLLGRVGGVKGNADPRPVNTLLQEGKTLLQTSGCLNCHGSNLANQFKAPSFGELLKSTLEAGCLDTNSTKAPRFSFASGEKEDIKTFLALRKPQAIAATFPHEDALQHTTLLQCAQCHQQSALPTPLALGGKLQPEWAARLIAGQVPYKPRPWLKTRMPAFPAYASRLAAGLAAIHGYPSRTPPEGTPKPELATLGAKLVSSAGGFSCVACHPVGDASTAVVVESPGVNLAYSGERLLSSFYHRWLMNPIAIDPGTKMPVYFDAEGRSQLTEFFDGDAAKQIDAIWHYLRLGDKMPAPPTP